MRKILLTCLLIVFVHTAKSQFHLIVNEFSQGNGGTKEFIELLVVGTRTCTDSTADIRNWIFDDQNGWYGAAGSGIAVGHYRFSNNSNWEKVPYGSVILIYNNGDQNGSIPAGIDDPTDANHNYVYILPVNNSLIEQNSATPTSPSANNFIYPTSGYSASSGWSSLGLSNSGDAVIITNPANLGAAHFSIIFGISAGGGFQTPTVTIGNVGANKNCYLSSALYSSASAWVVGDAGTGDETPGAGNNPANIAWIQSMRVQANAVPPTIAATQPTCASPTGTITVSAPTGIGYTYSIDGINFQSSPVFPGQSPNTYTVTVLAPGGCSSTGTAVINPAPGAPAAATTTLVQPSCTTTTGTITITNPVGPTYAYSIDGINFQASPVFPGLSPNTYTVTVQEAVCSSTSTVVINPVPGAPSNPTISIIQPTCTVTSGTITITAPVGAAYTYSVDGTNFQVSPVFSGLAPNTYTVTVQSAGCISTGAAVINAIPASPAQPTVTVIHLTCLINTGTITITAPVGAAYTYSIDGTNFQPNPVFPGLSPNTYTITVESAGCISTGTAVVNPVGNFILNLSATPNPAGQGSPVVLTTSSALTYQLTTWLPQNIFTNQTALSQTITATNTTDYFAVGLSSDGCIDTAKVTITVIPAIDDVFVPNVFTPNGDGKNDILHVYGNAINTVDFRIFNQWGEAIFKTVDKNKGWDGRFKSVMQPVAVYIYVLNTIMLDGSIVNKKGSVTLVR